MCYLTGSWRTHGRRHHLFSEVCSSVVVVKQIVKPLHAATSFMWHLYIMLNFCWKFKLKLPFTLCLDPINFLEVSIWKSSFVMPRKWGKRRNHIHQVCVQLAVQESLRTKISKHDFAPKTVQKLYWLPFQIKYDTKITMFQCKIIHSILATTMFFVRTKISDCLSAMFSWYTCTN